MLEKYIGKCPYQLEVSPSNGVEDGFYTDTIGDNSTSWLMSQSFLRTPCTCWLI
jgi:hypothetical protein